MVRRRPRNCRPPDATARPDLDAVAVLPHRLAGLAGARFARRCALARHEIFPHLWAIYCLGSEGGGPMARRAG